MSEFVISLALSIMIGVSTAIWLGNKNSKYLFSSTITSKQEEDSKGDEKERVDLLILIALGLISWLLSFIAINLLWSYVVGTIGLFT